MVACNAALSHIKQKIYWPANEILTFKGESTNLNQPDGSVPSLNNLDLILTFPQWPTCHLDFHGSSCCCGVCGRSCEHGGSTHFCVRGRTGGVRHAPSTTFIVSVGLISCLHIRSLFWIPSPQVTEHSLHSPPTHLQSHL